MIYLFIYVEYIYNPRPADDGMIINLMMMMVMTNMNEA